MWRQMFCFSALKIWKDVKLYSHGVDLIVLIRRYWHNSLTVTSKSNNTDSCLYTESQQLKVKYAKYILQNFFLSYFLNLFSNMERA